MAVRESTRISQSVADDEVDQVLAASRVLVAVSAQSLAIVEDVVDMTQFRVLVIIASHGSVSLGNLAEAARLHPSTASRLCDRMVSLGLINRADDPADRRHLTLTLTEPGRRIVDDVMGARRKAIKPILAGMPKGRRAELVTALREFAAAGGLPSDSDLWTMGWTT
jgi:DNA-binding MarR family transcriptional regulator